MKIYVDFNGMESCSPTTNEWCLDLTGYGTLASLSNHGIRLARGMVLTFADPDGLTVNAPVEFDEHRVSKASSGWYAKFKKTDLRNENPIEHDYNLHQCAGCRQNIKPFLDQVGRQYSENCPNCGTSVMFPLSPPLS